MGKPAVFVALVALALGVGMFLHTLFATDSWTERQRARADLETITAENDATERDVERLRTRIDSLRSRPEVQERVVRDELGYGRPGEVVVDLSK